MYKRQEGVQGGQLGGQAVVAVPAQADQVEEQRSRQGGGQPQPGQAAGDHHPQQDRREIPQVVQLSLIHI